MSMPDLKQQVELLEFQLEDFQARETQMRARYDSLLASVGPCGLCAAQESRLQETESRLVQTQRDCELALQDQQLAHEQAVLLLNTQLAKLQTDNAQLAWTVKSLSAVAAGRSRQKDNKALRVQMTKLRSELTTLRRTYDSEAAGLKHLLEESFFGIFRSLRLICGKCLWNSRFAKGFLMSFLRNVL